MKFPRQPTIVFFSLCVGIACAAPANPEGIRKAEQRLQAAQAAGDEAAVRSAASAWRTALGDQAGQPEGGTPKRIKIAPDTAPPPAAAVEYLEKYRAHIAPEIEMYLANLSTPAKLNAGLRQIAVPVIADAQAIASGMAPLQPLQSEMVRLADALCSVQHPNGLFAFPDIRSQNDHFGRMIQNLLAKHPEAVVDGWLVSDGGRGDLQYDNGLCGVALLETYKVTGEKKYLDAALRAAEWVKTQPVVTNWNYNSFSVWFLARLAIVTGKREWLDEAAKRCRLGVVPGQMPDGRWIDPHNAKLVYHAILCRALVELAVANREFKVVDPVVEKAAAAGLDNASEEILTGGVSVVTVPTEALALALLRWKDDPRWRKALSALASAGLSRTAPGSEIGSYAAAYLEYAKCR